jgi:polyhydroxyalkanoate synthesis regulator phasin
MSYTQKLEELLTKQVIPDIDDALDEIFEQIADEKNANDEQKEEIEELREFKSDLKDLLDDIKSGEIEDEESKEIYNDILEAQQGAEEEE